MPAVQSISERQMREFASFSPRYVPCLIVGPNSDVRLRATVTANNIVVSGRIEGYLAAARERNGSV